MCGKNVRAGFFLQEKVLFRKYDNKIEKSVQKFLTKLRRDDILILVTITVFEKGYL